MVLRRFFWLHIQNRKEPHKISLSSDTFTILGLWVLGFTVSHINESIRKFMSVLQNTISNDKSAILLHSIADCDSLK